MHCRSGTVEERDLPAEDQGIALCVVLAGRSRIRHRSRPTDGGVSLFSGMRFLR